MSEGWASGLQPQQLMEYSQYEVMLLNQIWECMLKEKKPKVKVSVEHGSPICRRYKDSSFNG